jgi:hypothetical protein
MGVSMNGSAPFILTEARVYSLLSAYQLSFVFLVTVSCFVNQAVLLSKSA